MSGNQHSDFNRDGLTDILWRNYATGDVDAWSMSGTSAIGVVDLITLPDPSWHLVGTSDFNRDGHADMLWRNQTTGDVHAWLMQGTTVSQAIAVCCLPDPNWQLTTTGDINNDGFADLLWHHQATGSNTAWVMSGTTPLASVALAAPSLESGWQVAAAVDFDQDGRSDVLWRNAITGENAIRLDVAGKGAIATLPSLPLPGWQIEGTGDFNHDTQADILWHNRTTGEAMVWVMAGATSSHTLFLPQTPGANAEPISLYSGDSGVGLRATPNQFNIEFDYRFDTNGFFNDPTRRAALEAAADFWEGIIQDEFPDVAAGTTSSVLNPATGRWERVTLTSGVDDLMIFVGAQTTPFNYPEPALARGGPGGFDATSSALSQRLRGADFEPWVGHISFDSSPAYADGTAAPWFFDTTPHTRNDIPAGQFDFFSVALHEVARVLGFGNSPTYLSLIRDRHFTGAATIAANGGTPVALDSSLTLIQENALTSGDRVLLMGHSGRNATYGTLPTNLDLAVLSDIGYRINEGLAQPAPSGIARDAAPVLATDIDDILFGSAAHDVMAGLAGNDQLQGDAGNDLLDGGTGNDVLFGQLGNDTLMGSTGNDQLVGGEGDDLLHGGTGNDVLFGQAGRDRFLLDATSGRDVISDFAVAEDIIQVAANTGFSSRDMVLGAIAPGGVAAGGGWFSELVLNPQNRVTIFHDAPLGVANFSIG